MLRKICFLFFQLVFNFKANRRHSQEHSMELPQFSGQSVFRHAEC